MHDAATFTARPAEPGDAALLEGLLARCSTESLYRRFHGAVGNAVSHELDRVVHPTARHRSWVVEVDGEVRGTSTLAWGRDGVAEAAFLVEDSWTRRGVGRALFAAMQAEALHGGTHAVTAWVQADNAAARRFLRAVSPQAVTSFAGQGELEITLSLAPVEVVDGVEVVDVDDVVGSVAPGAVAPLRSAS